MIFPSNYVNEIDRRLNNDYNKPIPRLRYFQFLNWFDILLSIHKPHYECQFENNKERRHWKYLSINGKRKRELDLIIETLVKHNILFESSYRFGNKSYTRTYQYTIDFIESYPFDNQISLIEDKLYSENINNLKSNSQYKLLMSDRFKIDVDSANNWVLNGLLNDSFAKQSALIYLKMINELNAKHIYVTKGEKCKRIYTSFSNLKRELRQFCYIDNKPLISLDLKSSQAYFFSHLILNNNENIRKFHNIITQQDIYIYIDTFLHIGREDVKTEFFHFLYKGNLGFIPIQRVIMDEFPAVYYKFLELNKQLQKKNKNLSTELQNEESDIFLPICEKYTNRGCLSVHDSLYFVEEIRGEIETDLKKILNDKGYSDYTLK